MKIEDLLPPWQPMPTFLFEDRFMRVFEIKTVKVARGELITVVNMIEVEKIGDRWYAPMPPFTLEMSAATEVHPSANPDYYTFSGESAGKCRP